MLTSNTSIDFYLFPTARFYIPIPTFTTSHEQSPPTDQSGTLFTSLTVVVANHGASTAQSIGIGSSRAGRRMYGNCVCEEFRTWIVMNGKRIIPIAG